MTFETSNKNVKNVDILKQDQRKMITPHLPAHVVVAQGASFFDQGLWNQGGWGGGGAIAPLDFEHHNIFDSMTTLLTHAVAHSNTLSFRLKSNNQSTDRKT